MFFYQMARKSSLNSVSRVWLYRVFFIILDRGTISTWILYKAFTGNKISRQNFMVILADEIQQECIMPKRSATVIEKSTSSPNFYRRQRQVSKFWEYKTKGNCILCKKKQLVVLLFLKFKKILLRKLYFRRALIIVKCIEIIED